MSVLVHSGCYLKTSWTKWIINNKHLLPIILETRKSKIIIFANSVSVEGPLPYWWVSSYLNLTWRKSKGSLWFSFLRALMPFMRALSLGCNHLPKYSHSNSISLGVRFQCMNGGGRRHKHSMHCIIHLLQHPWIKIQPSPADLCCYFWSILEYMSDSLQLGLYLEFPFYFLVCVCVYLCDSNTL